MAVFEPSKDFADSDLSSNSTYGRSIREGVRVVDFKNQKNQEGIYLFILPPYKMDSTGRTVSWKTYEIRDNFGIETKIKFASQPGCPVLYFGNQLKNHFPNIAKVEDINDPVSGQTRKRYPFCGRLQKRVIFNTAFTNDLPLGAHVLDVPVYNCGAKIDEWQRARFADGQPHPPINHAKAAWPVLFKLSTTKGGKNNPWTVAVSEQRSYVLPDELADAEYLYNLDDVILYPEKDWLIEQLRAMYPSDVFDKCMTGYFGPTVSPIRTNPTPAQIQPVASPQIQPVMQPSQAAVNEAPQFAPPPETEKIRVEHTANPMAGLGLSPKVAFPKATIGEAPASAPAQTPNTAANPLTAETVRQMLLNQKR